MRHFSRLGLVALSALAAAPLTADSYFVTTTNDSGAGSLRQAILDANAHPGFDRITFSIGAPASTRSRPRRRFRTSPTASRSWVSRNPARA